MSLKGFFDTFLLCTWFSMDVRPVTVVSRTLSYRTWGWLKTRGREWWRCGTLHHLGPRVFNQSKFYKAGFYCTDYELLLLYIWFSRPSSTACAVYVSNNSLKEIHKGSTEYYTYSSIPVPAGWPALSRFLTERLGLITTTSNGVQLRRPCESTSLCGHRPKMISGA